MKLKVRDRVILFRAATAIDHAAVGEILKKAKLEELLEHVGVWKP